MSHPKQTITLSLSSEIVTQLQDLAAEQHTHIDDVVSDLLSPLLQVKKHEVIRIVQTDRKELGSPPDCEGLREIIHRQDEEIIWLRDQITRLSTLTPTTHVIKHEYPAFVSDRPDRNGIPMMHERKTIPTTGDSLFHSESVPQSHVSVDDVQYTPPEPGIESEDIMEQGFLESGRAGEQTLRDFIGGIREEKEYSIREAAAIAGESDVVLIEYIANGFLPAQRDGSEYRIRGLDLRRYMMSK